MEMSFIESARNAERFFEIDHGESFLLTEGEGLVMISAPHSVTQTRGGVLKRAEPQTGALALLLHEKLNCPIICKTSNKGDDANFDMTSDYKDALAAHIRKNGIKFLIDLHQLSSERDVAIDVGTGRSKNLNDGRILDLILRVFSDKALGRVAVDHPFSGATDRTVSSFVRSSCNIDCVQIEINSGLVYGEGCGKTYEKVFRALEKTVTDINAYLGGKK